MIYRNPWQVLGIEPTTDKLIIKKAYTSLVKEINPEDDPKSFQEIHEAYKIALAMSKTLGKSSGVKVVMTSETMTPKTKPMYEPSAPTEKEKFDFSTVESKSEPEQERKEDKTDFDFSKIRSIDYNDDVGELIKQFIEGNNLKNAKEILFIDISERRRLGRGLLQFYLMMMERNPDDLSIWDRFVKEPLIDSLISDQQYCEYWLGSVYTTKKHYEYCDKLYKRLKPDLKKYTYTTTDREKKKYVFTTLGIFVIFTVFLIVIFLAING